MLYSDTDSFIYLIYNKDIYDISNDKVLGMFKDELKSLPMKEFTALNPKVYSYTNVSQGFWER